MDASCWTTCDPQHLDYYESLYCLLLSDQMLVTEALYERTRLFFSPLLVQLAGLHRALFEVLCEHKSLLIKVPCSENDLNKHSTRIIPSPGSSNLPAHGGRGQAEAGGGIMERIPEDVAVWRGRAQPFGGCFSCPECITAA